MYVAALLAAGAVLAHAQSPQPGWRKVGSSAVELMLAAPATGPVDQVWFSPDGATLYARTHSNKVFQTNDFENWAVAPQPPDPPATFAPAVYGVPERGAHPVMVAANLSRIYALGRQLYRSRDDGRTWENLTAYGSQVVVGAGQHSVAVSIANPDHVVVANDFGVWRSTDGGLSWAGLNRSLPNLAVRKILSTPVNTTGVRVDVENLGVLELPPGGSVWYPVAGQDSELSLRQRYSALLRTEISAVGTADESAAVYAGGADGSIWVSVKGGDFTQSRPPSGSRVERIFVDPAAPGFALAALSGKGPHILRTTNYGNGGFWDSLDGNLPDSAAHAVTADRQAGAVYLATDKGVFWARTDLENPSTEPVSWTGLPAQLPANAVATDVRLDPAGIRLYAALDGYGVYTLPAPHRVRNIRIVNAGDYSTRPASPGSLLSVIGGKVTAARGGNLDYPVFPTLGNGSQIQVPFEAVGPTVNLSLQTAEGPVHRDLAVQPVSPTILLGPNGLPVLLDGETGMPLDLKNAARANSRMQIWATGLGKVRPDWRAGEVAPMDNPPAVVASVRVFVNGVSVPVTRATLLPGYTGFYLIEVELPSINNTGMSELYINADGQESNRVQFLIEQ